MKEYLFTQCTSEQLTEKLCESDCLCLTVNEESMAYDIRPYWRDKTTGEKKLMEESVSGLWYEGMPRSIVIEQCNGERRYWIEILKRLNYRLDGRLDFYRADSMKEWECEQLDDWDRRRNDFLLEIDDCKKEFDLPDYRRSITTISPPFF